MLWIESHRPKTFNDITSHSEIVSILKQYTLETIPNIILHGHQGNNKKTLLYALINNLYNKYPNPINKNLEIKLNSQIININYLESDEIIEIVPSDYGTKDRHVIQTIIKQIAENKPILSYFEKKKPFIKILIINRAEDLSKDAQAALRRTMEKYSNNIRLFMICNELSKLIEPIRSRSIFFCVRSFFENEIINICKKVLEKENFMVENEIIEGIAKNAAGDCGRALCILELYCFNYNENEFKKQKQDLTFYKLDWEKKIDKIVEIIKKNQNTESFLLIRNELYSLLNDCISSDIILLEMAKKLKNNNNFEISKKIMENALIYDERIRLSKKHLFHLEAFAASAMKIYLNNK